MIKFVVYTIITSRLLSKALHLTRVHIHSTLEEMQVTVRELRSNLSKYLKEGCVVVDGKTKEVIAKIVAPSEPNLKEKYELQKRYIKQLEMQITVPTVVPTIVRPVVKPKYIPQPCQFYRKCDNLSVGQFSLGQVINGSWVEVPFKHLCQKHADFVARDKAASWDL